MIAQRESQMKEKLLLFSLPLCTTPTCCSFTRRTQQRRRELFPCKVSETLL